MSRQSAYNRMKSEVIGKAFDVDGYYGAQCPVKGTMISMADGSYKPVEELKTGDIVSTGNIVITNKQRLSSIMKVKTDCGIFRVSPEHKFILTDGSQMKAEDLCKGDRIDLDMTGPARQTLLTNDELRFLGFFLANGSKKYCHDYSQLPEILVTVCADDKLDYLQSLNVTLIESIHSNEKAKVYTLLNCRHKELVSIINYLDGNKLGRNWSAEEFKYIIEGYLKADGYRKRKRVVVNSSCKDLLISIQYGCLLNGWKASLTDSFINGETCSDEAKKLYRLVVNPGQKPKGKVRWIREDGEDTICVLNLNGNHLYYGDNHLHHNCWDFAAYVMKNYYGGRYISCGISGYVKDIANQRKTNGILNFMDDIPLTQTLEPGDICIWGECPACPLSHIAIYDHDNGQNAVFFLGQNQGGYGVTVRQIPVNGIIGVFRPKKIAGEGEEAPKKTAKPKTVLNTIPDDFHREVATFTVAVDSIKIREAPSIAGKDTGLVYKKGQSVIYDGYVIREGYIWLSWISASTGTRRWMACGTKDAAGNVSHWGTFR